MGITNWITIFCLYLQMFGIEPVQKYEKVI